jgi:hypothetical protein
VLVKLYCLVLHRHRLLKPSVMLIALADVRLRCGPCCLFVSCSHGYQGSEVPDFDSLGMGLVPSESVPVGRINHEHVIPFSELTLKELIGSGAEGKVGWHVQTSLRCRAAFMCGVCV